MKKASSLNNESVSKKCQKHTISTFSDQEKQNGLEYIAVILLISPHQITIRDNIEQVPEIISGGAWCGGAIMMFHFALAGKINSIYAAKISATILRK